jgi:hypothetical protein
VRDWLARYERFWTDRLEELAEFVEAEKSEKRRKP